MLELSGVTAYYGKTPILFNISLSIGKGECLCVLGRNGVGKTTLLKTIMGLVDRMSGELTIDQTKLTRAPTASRAKAGLGYVPQGRRILGKFSVKQNLELGSFARGDGASGIPESCLENFPYLRENLNRRAGLLSGGQQQQLAIARALATDPKVLLLDEPTEGIQPNIVADIRRTMQHLNRDLGLTLLLTEQHIKIARELADKFLILDVGRVVAQGPIAELSDDLIQKHLTI
ncbi:MAG: urea ABC transporter ATP-binding subunit UrtE [Kiloniellales bacterium]